MVETILKTFLEVAKQTIDKVLVKEMLTITGKHPNELNLLLYHLLNKVVNERLPINRSMIHEYASGRQDEIMRDHIYKFKLQVLKTQEDRDTFNVLVSYLDMDITVPLKYNSKYDRLLMYFQDDKAYSILPLQKKYYL